jgi:hypothetical protein
MPGALTRYDSRTVAVEHDKEVTGSIPASPSTSAPPSCLPLLRDRDVSSIPPRAS